MKLNEFFKGKNNINIGFLGGSITEGAAASEKSKRYASLVVSGLSDMYSDINFKEINAGVGGTDSACGLFRLRRDILSFSPDILFVEYAVNDYSFENRGIYMENIILEVKKYRKDIPIILIYTSTAFMFEEYKQGKIPASVKGHSALCKPYSLNEINVGYGIFEKGIELSGLLTDGVHPNDDGHKLYSEIILSALSEFDIETDNSEKELLYGKRLYNPDLILCSDFAGEGWELKKDMFGKLPEYICSQHAGDEFSFDFYGSFLGMYYTVESDSGIMEYRIDDGEWINVNCWDEYARDFDRPAFKILNENLPDGKHTVAIRNSGKKDEGSKGYSIRIGAFAAQLGE